MLNWCNVCGAETKWCGRQRKRDNWKIQQLDYTQQRSDWTKDCVRHTFLLSLSLTTLKEEGLTQRWKVGTISQMLFRTLDVLGLPVLEVIKLKTCWQKTCGPWEPCCGSCAGCWLRPCWLIPSRRSADAVCRNIIVSNRNKLYAVVIAVLVAETPENNSTNDDIHASLDSLCISMMEHALGN